MGPLLACSSDRSPSLSADMSERPAAVLGRRATPNDRTNQRKERYAHADEDETPGQYLPGVRYGRATPFILFSWCVVSHARLSASLSAASRA